MYYQADQLFQERLKPNFKAVNTLSQYHFAKDLSAPNSQLNQEHCYD
jgi:hypothetical protein